MLLDLFLRDPGDGGVSATPTDITMPTQTIDVTGGEKMADDVNPFEATPEQLERIGQEGAGKQDRTPTFNQEIEISEADLNPAEETPTETPAEEFYADDKEFLADLGPDFAQYETVQDALLALHQKNQALEPEFQKVNQVMERLDKVAKQLGVSPDAIIESLAAVDPRGMAQQGPQWQNLTGWMQQNVSADHQPFYQQFGASLLQDIIPAVQGQFGRILNGLEASHQDLVTDFQLLKFTSNAKNAEWVGREQELKNALEQNPQYRGKPNAMDLAARWVKAGAEPASVKTQVNKGVKEKLQALKAKQRGQYVEGPGRGTPSRPAQTDFEKMTPAEKEAVIDNLEKRGITLR